MQLNWFEGFVYGHNEEVGSSKNSGLLAAWSLRILIPPFGGLLGESMGSGAVLYYHRI